MRATAILPGLLLVSALAGCSDHSQKTLIVQPKSGKYALTGRVRLVGRLSETPFSSDSSGARVIDDASGVQVHLERPDGTVDSAVTVGGAYEFRFDAPGLYRVFVWVAPPETAATSQVAAAARDTFFADTLFLGPHGAVDTYPNPFSARGVDPGIGVELTPVDSGTVSVSFSNLSNVPVYTDTRAVTVHVLYHLHWMGTDHDDVEVPNGSYWAVAVADGVTRYNLIFKQ